jgi:hypothetical protein
MRQTLADILEISDQQDRQNLSVWRAALEIAMDKLDQVS